MNTTQIIERPFFGSIVRQEHDTGFLCVSDFMKIANKYRAEHGISNNEMNPKIISEFFKNKNSKEFITELAIYENVLQKDLKKTRRGKYTGVWVHPSLFLKIALWTSPKLEVRVYEWVMDEMLSTRDQGGNSFKKIMSSLKKKYPEMSGNRIWYQRVSRVIYNLCGLDSSDPNRWNKATIEQQKKRLQIHEQLDLLKDMHESLGDLLVYVWNYNTKNGTKPSCKNLNCIP